MNKSTKTRAPDLNSLLPLQQYQRLATSMPLSAHYDDRKDRLSVEKQRQRLAIIMQRRALDNNPWQSHAWEPFGVLVDYEGDAEARLILDCPGTIQWLYPGFQVVLRRSEAEGYFHNMSTVAPNVFILWRAEGDRAVPHYVTVSYDEASRWMDGGARVDPVAMPLAMRAWVREFVEMHYRPEPKKRLRPQSFVGPQERARV